MKTKHLFLGIFSLLFLVAACGDSTPEEQIDDDTSESIDSTGVKYSFIVIGCNRISWSDDKAAWKSSPYYNEAHTNLNQLNATFDDVLALENQPDFFFFVGDLVLAENKDTNVLVDQLTAWKQLYHDHSISQSNISMVAIPGNHEFLYSEAPTYNEVPNPYAHDIWLRLMNDFIIGSNGPVAGGPDSLTYNESQLTYSVDHKGDHFILMNTDTYPEPGKVPVNWITNDISSFRSGNPDGHIFLMGHKPAYDATGMARGSTSDPGLAWDTNQVHMLWDSMNHHRCEAMLSAHEHLFWAGIPNNSHSWQVIAGNGGTTLDSGDFFGFTEVQVMHDGTVKAISHGRPVPTPDYGALTGTTTIRNTYDLTWPEE